MLHIRRAFGSVLLLFLILAGIRMVLRALGGSRSGHLRRFNKHILNPFALRIIARRKTYYGVVHHVGRRSGKPYATPVVAKLTSAGVVIPLPYGADTDWCLNVLAADQCTLKLNGESYALTMARVVDPEVAEPLLPQVNARLWRWIGVQHYLLLDIVRASADTSTSTIGSGVLQVAESH